MREYGGAQSRMNSAKRADLKQELVSPMHGKNPQNGTPASFVIQNK